MTETNELTAEEQLAEAWKRIAEAEETIVDLSKQNTVLRLKCVQQSSSESLRAIIRNLLTLKWHKDTFGKTPEYLEAMPKAWEEAKEVVK